MAEDLNLTAQQIYEKAFRIDDKGYSAEEVDAFLDQIIDDYQMYDEKIKDLGLALLRYEDRLKELESLNASLQAANDGLRQDLSRMKDQAAREKEAAAAAEKEEKASSAGNESDIIRRLNRLEEAVFSRPVKE